MIEKTYALLEDGNFQKLLQKYRYHGLTYDEFKMLKMPEGSSVTDAWRLLNLICRAFGYSLPFDWRGGAGTSTGRDWYFLTDLLRARLAECMVKGINNPHVNTTLLLPEGRHFKLRELGMDCYACIIASGWSIQRERFTDLILQLTDPLGATEQLAYNYYQIMLDSLADEAYPCTPESMEDMFTRIVKGIELPADSLSEKARLSRRPILDAICKLAEQPQTVTDSDTALMRALTALEMCKILEPFPIANVFIGRMLFSCILRQNGMALISYVPIVAFFVGWKQGDLAAWSYSPNCDYTQSIQVFEGTRDWTIYFEELLAFMVKELSWMSNKLSGFNLRRERLTELFEYDHSHNSRQKDVLIEALVHEDAEFTFEKQVEITGVVYSTAHNDLVELQEQGFLDMGKRSKKTYFVATTDIRNKIHALLEAASPEAYHHYYDSNGELQSEIKAMREEAFQSQTSLYSNDNSGSFTEYWPVYKPETRRRVLSDD